MNRKTLLFTAVLALTGAAALAQSGPGPGMMRGGMGGMWGAVDADHDGKISRDEYRSHVDSMFAVMDANGDGKLTKEEFASLHMGPGAGMMGGRKAAMFESMDTNHDGVVDKDEFVAAHMARFDKADAGHTGMLMPGQMHGMNRP